MKKIGFVDYYISEWHANNYPDWIKAAAKRAGEDFVLSYAWAELDKSPEDGVTTAQWCEKHGAEQCKDIAELCTRSDYIIVLSPSNPEKHLQYASEVFKFGKHTYVDKTFAPDYATARRIFAAAEENGTAFFSSSALRFADEIAAFAPSASLSVYGGGRSLEEYIIHQVEMAVKIQGIGAESVTVFAQDGGFKVEIAYPDSRRTVLNYNDANSFSVSDGERCADIDSPFFENLISDILRFFKTGEVSFDVNETLEVMKIREAAVKGCMSLGETVTL